MTSLPLMNGINPRNMSLHVTAPNEAKKTKHFVSWRTFRRNYKASERQLKNEAQQEHCQRPENGKTKYSCKAESLVNACNFVKKHFFQTTFHV